jgi:hypothetical protein
VDPGGRHLRRFIEIEIIERLHARQASLLYPSDDGVVFALFQLGSKQGLETAQISLTLLGSYIGKRCALFGHRGQAQPAALLLDCGLFQVLGSAFHGCASEIPVWFSSWSYPLITACGRS